MASHLAKSNGYLLEADYEVATITGYGHRIVVGDHYGDVVCGYIDVEERWCVTGGEGLVVYFLNPPFEDYRRRGSAPQWAEACRSLERGEWPESVRQLDPETVRVTSSRGIYDLNVYSLDLAKASEA